MNPSEVLFLDEDLLAVCKPAGMLVQGDRTGDPTLLAQAREYLRRKFHSPDEVYLGLVHRLDRPTSGVTIFARNSKAAAHLSAQFQNRTARKTYWALVEGKVPDEGNWVDNIVRMGVTSRVVKRGGEGQEAVLYFRCLGYRNDISWVEIELHTGRHHQIRVQFAYRGHPVVGDLRYGAEVKFGQKALALHARALTITHPTQGTKMTFTAEPARLWPKYFR